MYVLSDVQKLLVVCFLATTMISLGLKSRKHDLLGLLRSPGLLIRALLANFVAVPLLGFLLVRLWPLPPESAGALVLLACVPGGLATIKYTSKVKGEAALAAALFLLFTVLAIIISPLIVRMALPAGADLNIPYGRALVFVAISIVVPLGIGILLRNRSPQLTSGLSRVLDLVGLVLFVALAVATRSYKKEALASIGGPAVGAMALFILSTMAIGWFVGGPSRETRQLMATVTSVRNVALCLMIAKSSPAGDAVLTPLVAFSLLMLLPNALLGIYGSIRERRIAGRAGDST